MNTSTLLVFSFVAVVAGYCPYDKIVSTGNCSFRIECRNTIQGVRLRNECLESINDPALIDVTLNEAVENHDHADQDFLSFITSLRISAHWPKTKLSLLNYTTRLEYLYLAGNGIEVIEGEPFKTLNNLEVLDLSYNKLTDIEELFVFELQPNKLRKLFLTHNRLDDLSDAFSELTSLVELDLSHNLITDLTMEPFSNLTSLEVLKLNNNSIIDLNGAVNNLQNLRHLYLRGNQINNIDVESLKIIIHLETFDVSLNNLERIKPVLFSRHWRHLGGHPVCKIILSENHITFIPNAINKLITTRFARHVARSRNIDVHTELDLSKNQISNIEYNAFQSIIKLISLDLSSNKIITFIVNADDLMFVKYLNLSSNYITNLYFESFSRMNNLQTLDLSHNALDYISKQTFDNSYNLKHVNMSFNSIQKVRNLHINMFHPEGGALDLSNNNLTQLRIPYGEGLHLTRLILCSNNITDPTLVDLWYQTDLKHLDLSKNSIRELDDNSFRLPGSLTHLDLSCNHIAKIGPSSFTRINHLNNLRLSHNRLKTIEYGAFRGLSSLSYLDLDYNNIHELDSKLLMDLKSLSILSLTYNGLFVLNEKSWYGHKIPLKVYLDGNNFTCEWLAAALKNYENGYSKMRPAVREGAMSSHSLDGIPCSPGDQLANLGMQPEIVMADERLLLTTQKILEAVREQTFYLKKFIWRSIEDEASNFKNNSIHYFK